MWGVDTLASDNFNEVVAATEKPVLVVFGYEWCDACQSLLGELNGSYSELDACDKYFVELMDSEDLKDAHRIQITPTTALFLGGREWFRREGRLAAKDLAQAVRGFENSMEYRMYQRGR